MAEDSKKSVGDSNRGWVRHPYGCSIGMSFSNYKEQLIEIMLAGSESGGKDVDVLSEKSFDNAKTADAATFGEDAESVVKSVAGIHDQQKKADTNLGAHLVDLPSVTDSSIFGNDAINPYSGFCRDDDIVHQEYKSKAGNHTFRMGRVYNEIYNSKQQVVYMQFGIPKYRNLFHFITNAASAQMSEMNDEGSSSIISKVANFFIDGTKFAINIVTLPLEWAWRFFEGLDSVKVTEYFYFKEQMFMYWNYVNTILIHIASGIGLYNASADKDGMITGQEQELPQILRGTNNGPDIYQILSCRGSRYGAGKVAGVYAAASDPTKGVLMDPEKMDADKAAKNSTSDKTLKTWTDKVSDTLSEAKSLIETTYKGFWSQTWGEIKESVKDMYNGWESGALDSSKWLAFRLEKDSDNSSESFNNSLSTSSLQEELNGFVASNRSNNLDASTAGGGILGAINRNWKKINTWKQVATEILSRDRGAGALTSMLGYVMSGNGYYDLPQQWSGSSFSRSVNINVRLRSRTGGDPISIYTNIIVPFACILAGACPRADGSSTYTSPFIVRAYCRGMFAVSAGMITSLSITRGDSEFGWSIHRLPTTMAIQMQITDLSPILFLSISGADAGVTEIFGIFKQAFVNNTKMHDYLDTISGMGLKQRIYWGMGTWRNTKIAGRIIKSHWGNPTYWGMLFADTWMSRSVMAFRRAGNMNVPSN